MRKFAAAVLWFVLLTCGARSQSRPQPSTSDKKIDNLGLQVEDSKEDSKPDQAQPEPSQPSAGEKPSSKGPESTISSKEAKELFRSVDEILKFASDDTDLPIKHEVKRKLTKRDEVQSYVEKNMREDKDAKRLERSTEVLKKFGLLPRDFDLPKFLVAMLREQVAGYYDVKTKTVNLLNWLDAEQQKPVTLRDYEG